MKNVLIVYLLFICTLTAGAQNSKTGVVVLGNGNTAFAAGIQAARSGVQTTLILQSQDFSFVSIHGDEYTGMETEFLKRIRKAKGLKDSTAKVTLDQATVSAVLKNWADSTKNLTVIRSARFHRFKRSGSGWNIELSTGRSIKAKVLVNADRPIPYTADVQVPGATGSRQWQPLDYANTIYRTSVASSGSEILSLYSLLQSGQENFIAVHANRESMTGGQAAGAAAAYAVFFNKKTSELHLKTIQGELVHYSVPLMPFVDVPLSDSNWKAIQFVSLMGVLKGELKEGKVYFNPDQDVRTEEVQQPLKDLFYKAQIWFDDYKAEYITLDAAVRLASYVGNKSPKSTLEAVQKNWEKNYKFKTAFDVNKVVTRREFVSILHDYSPPFNVTIDQNGRIIR